MEKFLNFSFKFGKMFTVILLVILMFLIVCSGFKTLTTLKSAKLNIPTFTEIANNARAAQSNVTETKEKNIPQYILVINETAKILDLNNYAKNILLTSLNEINEDYKVEYTLGLKQFLTEYYAFAKNQPNPNVSGEQLTAVLNDYKFYFNKNVAEKETQEAKIQTDRIMALSVFTISLLLFIMCLLIPLLIKIEENTRK